MNYKDNSAENKDTHNHCLHCMHLRQALFQINAIWCDQCGVNKWYETNRATEHCPLNGSALSSDSDALRTTRTIGSSTGFFEGRLVYREQIILYFCIGRSNVNIDLDQRTYIVALSEYFLIMNTFRLHQNVVINDILNWYIFLALFRSKSHVPLTAKSSSTIFYRPQGDLSLSLCVNNMIVFH